MLDSHAEVTCCEGFEFLVERMGDDGSTPSVEEYAEYLETSPIFGSSGLTLDPAMSYVENAHNFFAQRLDVSGKNQIGAMVHYDFARLLHLFPDARFIHVLRDPRDVTSSVINMGWAGNVYHGLDRWLAAETQWKKFIVDFPEDRRLEVPYADLIGDHVATLERVCDFMGISYTEQMLDYRHTTDYDIPDPTRVSAWSRTLSDREIQLVEGRVGDLLTEGGFEPSGLEPIKPTPAELKRLAAENKLGVWKSRVDRFGLRLTLERGLTRLVPIPAWRRSVALRFNAIERANRKRSWRAEGREVATREESATS